MRKGMAAFLATGAELGRPVMLGWLAEACGKFGRTNEGLTLLAEALTFMNETGERVGEAVLYRIKGELLLKRAVPDEHEAVGAICAAPGG